MKIIKTANYMKIAQLGPYVKPEDMQPNQQQIQPNQQQIQPNQQQINQENPEKTNAIELTMQDHVNKRKSQIEQGPGLGGYPNETYVIDKNTGEFLGDDDDNGILLRYNDLGYDEASGSSQISISDMAENEKISVLMSTYIELREAKQEILQKTGQKLNHAEVIAFIFDSKKNNKPLGEACINILNSPMLHFQADLSGFAELTLEGIDSRYISASVFIILR